MRGIKTLVAGTLVAGLASAGALTSVAPATASAFGYHRHHVGTLYPRACAFWIVRNPDGTYTRPTCEHYAQPYRAR